jgi:hypothetical protein
MDALTKGCFRCVRPCDRRRDSGTGPGIDRHQREIAPDSRGAECFDPERAPAAWRGWAEARRKSARLLRADDNRRVVLVDTSIWINHFRSGNDRLEKLLDEQKVLGYPFVIGEIAMGEPSNMSTILRDLSSLPAAAVVHGRRGIAFYRRPIADRRGDRSDRRPPSRCHILDARFQILDPRQEVVRGRG